MKRRIWSVLLTLVLLLQIVPTTAFAFGNGTNDLVADSGNDAMKTEYSGVIDETFELGELETSAGSGMALFSLDTGTVDLKEGTFPNWIDRVELPECAVTFYNTLAEGSDDDGTDDILIDEFSTAGITTNYASATEGDFVTLSANYTDGTSAKYNAIFVTKITAESSTARTAQLTYINACIAAAYAAFDRDHPEVFWLGNSSQIATKAGSNGTEYYAYVFFLLYRTSDTESLRFDIRDDQYQSENAIKQGIEERESYIESLLSDDTGFPSSGTDAEKVTYFNNWLTTHNEYNTNLNNAAGPIRKCISALAGRTGEDGPVCEGYARAFKVLCDRCNIPCVLVDGVASSSNNPGEAHMWNYVQIDGAWYAVDVTWNDPTGGNSGAVSGYEGEQYLLVGSDTVIGSYGKTFIESHPVSNKVSTNGVGFTNGPVLSATDYTDPNAPDSMELTFTPSQEGTSSSGWPAFSVPTVQDLNTPASKEITLTAAVQNANGDDLPDQTVRWSLVGTPDGITLTPVSNAAAKLTITNSALRTYDGNRGPVITVAASCSTTKAEQKFLIYVPTRTAKFVQIWKNDDVMTSDSITPGSSAAYTATVYDQYGQEMSGQTVTWTVSNSALAAVTDGIVTVSDSAETGSSFTVTASTENGTASAAVAVAVRAPAHNFSTAWSRDAEYHWHACTDDGCTEIADKAEHTWDEGTVTAQPTCGTDGEMTQTCTVCGETRTVVIPATRDHTFNDEGICTVCGAKDEWDGTAAYEPAQDADGVYQISSGEELAWFRDFVNEGNTAANAKLTRNINMGVNTWTSIGGTTVATAYTGTFDGGGYTITFSSTADSPQGLFAYVGAAGVVRNVVVAGSFTGSAGVGGVAVYNAGTIEYCVNKAGVTGIAGENSLQYVGGIAARNCGSILNCANEGAVTASAATDGCSAYAGGIFGCGTYSTGAVKSDVSIENCYNWGGVSAANSAAPAHAAAGGIGGCWAGSADNKRVIQNCYSTGAVSVSEGGLAGGIIGLSNSDDGVAAKSTMTNCWYLEGTASAAYNADAAAFTETNTGAKTAAELQGADFVANDIAGYQAVHGGYPVLSWQEAAGPEEPAGTITLASATLELKSEVYLNIYTSLSDFVGPVDPTQAGLMVWTGSDEDYAESDFTYGNSNVTVYAGAAVKDGEYVVKTAGIAAKELGDEHYMRAFVDLGNGKYVYSTVTYYGPQTYALDRLKNSTDENLKKTLVAMLDYAAAAQIYFDYRTDDLANAIDEQYLTAYRTEYSAEMLDAVIAADAVGEWTRDRTNCPTVLPSLILKGIITNHYTVQFSDTIMAEGQAATFKFWNEAAYTAMLQNGTTFAETDPTLTVTVDQSEDGYYYGGYNLTAAKDLGSTLYLCVEVTTNDGTTYRSGVIAYSAHAYINERLTNSTNADLKTLLEKLAVYGDAAKTYFADRV